MPPKAHETIDSLLALEIPSGTMEGTWDTEQYQIEDDYGFWDLYSNWRNLVNAESPEAEKDTLLEFYKYADAGPYGKTYVPGEHELLARMLGIEDYVNQYMYGATESLRKTNWKGEPVDAFETLIEGLQSGEGTTVDDIMLHTFHEEEPWPEVAMGSWDGEVLHRRGGTGKSYTKEESPLLDYGDYFGVNPETEFGENLQDRLDFYFTQAKLYKNYKKNPDTGESMLAGEDPLLGTVYFDERGNFVDVWDIAEGEHESTSPPLGQIFDPNKSWLSSLGFNIGRKIAGPDYQKNIPIIKGRAYLLDDINPYIGREGL